MCVCWVLVPDSSTDSSNWCIFIHVGLFAPCFYCANWWGIRVVVGRGGEMSDDRTFQKSFACSINLFEGWRTREEGNTFLLNPYPPNWEGHLPLIPSLHSLCFPSNPIFWRLEHSLVQMMNWIVSKWFLSGYYCSSLEYNYTKKMQVVHEEFGIVEGLMTTVHATTGLLGSNVPNSYVKLRSSGCFLLF